MTDEEVNVICDALQDVVERVRHMSALTATTHSKPWKSSSTKSGAVRYEL